MVYLTLPRPPSPDRHHKTFDRHHFGLVDTLPVVGRWYRPRGTPSTDSGQAAFADRAHNGTVQCGQQFHVGCRGLSRPFGNRSERWRSLPSAFAITHYETAWQLAEQKGWPEAVSGADRQTLYGALGRAYELTEAWVKAQKIYETMIAHAQSLEAAAIECRGLNHLATVSLNGLQDRPQALQILEQVQRVAEQSGDRRGLAETEWNLSLAAIQAQNAKLALQHSERALAIAQELGHPHLLARCLTSREVCEGHLKKHMERTISFTEGCVPYAASCILAS